MRRLEFRLYAWAIGIAALAAAACGHIAVDLLASLRVFTGTHSAYRHQCLALSIATVCVVALVFATLSAVDGIRTALGRSSGGERLAMLRAMRRPHPMIGALVYCLQIPVLLSVEAIEQFQSLGHPIGITAALGGPPAISLAIHALFALAVTLVVFRAIRAIADGALGIARIIAPIIRRRGLMPDRSTPASARVPNGASPVGNTAPLALRIANRPPPAIAIS